nr:hypothetical protein RVX_2674 [Nitratidesulfovibrio sp. HK-II]
MRKVRRVTHSRRIRGGGQDVRKYVEQAVSRGNAPAVRRA